MNYECYIARYNNSVMYVGEGRRDRHLHITSGTSHVYGANKCHFLGIKLDVEVIPVRTKEEAKSLEQKLIDKHKPVWNIIGTPKERVAQFLGRERNRAKLERRSKPLSRIIFDIRDIPMELDGLYVIKKGCDCFHIVRNAYFEKMYYRYYGAGITISKADRGYSVLVNFDILGDFLDSL